jgi:hypothetical protein
MLIQLVVALIVLGLLLWVVSQIPMDPTIARIIHVVIIVVAVLYLLEVFTGVFGGMALMGPPLRR